MPELERCRHCGTTKYVEYWWAVQYEGDDEWYCVKDSDGNLERVCVDCAIDRCDYVLDAD